MQFYANGFDQIETHWRLRDGDQSLISNISCTKQSNLLWHFLRTENCLLSVLGQYNVCLYSACQ